MRDVNVSIPEMIFVALTRGMAGAGIGLLAADLVKPDARKPVGWTLIAIGALTTLPIAATLIGRARRPLLAD
jgi:sorbitol-specific phosphotransferase system component IIBC